MLLNWRGRVKFMPFAVIRPRSFGAVASLAAKRLIR